MAKKYNGHPDLLRPLEVPISKIALQELSKDDRKLFLNMIKLGNSQVQHGHHRIMED